MALETKDYVTDRREASRIRGRLYEAIQPASKDFFKRVRASCGKLKDLTFRRIDYYGKNYQEDTPEVEKILEFCRNNKIDFARHW